MLLLMNILEEIGVLVRQYDYFQILNTVEMINRVKLIMSSDSFRNFLVRSLSTAVIVPISGYIIIVGGNYFSIFISMLGAVMIWDCLLYTSPSPRDVEESRMPSSA